MKRSVSRAAGLLWTLAAVLLAAGCSQSEDSAEQQAPAGVADTAVHEAETAVLFAVCGNDTFQHVHQVAVGLVANGVNG